MLVAAELLTVLLEWPAPTLEVTDMFVTFNDISFLDSHAWNHGLFMTFPIYYTYTSAYFCTWYYYDVCMSVKLHIIPRLQPMYVTLSSAAKCWVLEVNHTLHALSWLSEIVVNPLIFFLSRSWLSMFSRFFYPESKFSTTICPWWVCCHTFMTEITSSLNVTRLALYPGWTVSHVQPGIISMVHHWSPWIQHYITGQAVYTYM